jgi:hypothetical protein
MCSKLEKIKANAVLWQAKSAVRPRSGLHEAWIKAFSNQQYLLTTCSDNLLNDMILFWSTTP